MQNNIFNNTYALYSKGDYMKKAFKKTLTVLSTLTLLFMLVTNKTFAAPALPPPSLPGTDLGGTASWTGGGAASATFAGRFSVVNSPITFSMTGRLFDTPQNPPINNNISMLFTMSENMVVASGGTPVTIMMTVNVPANITSITASDVSTADAMQIGISTCAISSPAANDSTALNIVLTISGPTNYNSFEVLISANYNVDNPYTGPAASTTPSDSQDDSGALEEDIASASALAAETGGLATIRYSSDNALTSSVMKTLFDNPNVSFDYTFLFDEKEYNIFIPAGEAIYDPNIPVYGPLWLIAHYGSHRTYTIQSGDTLGAVASSLGTSVKSILARNPEITNPNVIYAGQVIKY